MKTQIVHVSKLQSAKVMAALYFVISIPLLLFMMAPSLVTHQPIPWGTLWWMPLMYTAMGLSTSPSSAPGFITASPA